jgi:hypothetical protein
MTASRSVLVPPERLVRWFATFADRHGVPAYDVVSGRLHASAPDGTSATAALPFGRDHAGWASPEAFRAAAEAPDRWGVLLVRRGGFAVASVTGDRVVAAKVGRRHVQGRTKAGGQSQQRFARRRDNQARQAYEAAAGHAAGILGGPLDALVCGGDRPGVERVLDDPRLRHLAAVRVGPWLAVPDPRRAVLDQAVRDGRSVAVVLSDPVDEQGRGVR